MPKNKEIHLRQLPIFEHHGQLVTDSRDVAALIGKRHNAPHGTFAVGEYKDITDNENDGTAQLTGGKEE